MTRTMKPSLLPFTLLCWDDLGIYVKFVAARDAGAASVLALDEVPPDDPRWQVLEGHVNFYINGTIVSD